MNIEINNESYNCTEEKTLQDIANRMDLNKPGVAIAVNMRVISRDKWDNYNMSENDKVIIINATCGG